MKLFVINDKVLFFNQYKTHIDTGIIYRPLHSSLAKFLRRIHLKSKFPFFHIWYSRDFKNCGKLSDVIILFDTILTIPASRYIIKQYPNMRIIYWYWNHIYNTSMVRALNAKVEKWSYDFEDCKKYNLIFNTQFYFPELVQPSINTNILQDFIFVGAKKGRLKYIEQCEKMIDLAGLTKRFVVSNNTRSDRIKKWINYPDLIQLILQTRCIVDIVADTQKGITLRPLEALFFGKKLLTNFQQIESYEFYHPDNIFIIGKDNPAGLRNFVYSSFNHIVDVWKDYYSFENWLKRFSNN